MTVETFIKRVLDLPPGPGAPLDVVLQPSLDDEADLRKLFASDRTNPRLKDPYVGLVDVFAVPAPIRTTRARVVPDEQALSAKYVMPLSEQDRRKDGEPCTIDDLDEFKKNWAVFTEGSLAQLIDWSNIVAAGGAVLACLMPMSTAVKESKRSKRKFFHSAAYPSSDIDLFLWGVNAEEAEKRIIAIYDAVRDSVPWDVTCVRTKHTVSIISQYPYRSIQIVLRLYSSPGEVLAGFDIDAPCCLYDGNRVYANPRCIVSLMRQANTVDMTRRSPSYEVRLAKYSKRGFEVFVPSLNRDKIDPTIYERSITGIEGLARLLVLEKLYEDTARNKFLFSRRELRGRPDAGDVHRRYYKKKNKYKSDLKFDTSVMALEMNDYDVSSLHIPYGPAWTAKRIEKLVYQTDLGMNSTFNPKNKNRRLHRHPAFFGTMPECLEDCCEFCPMPIDSDERTLQTEEDKQYIRGRVSFIADDPGRQMMTGSFNPIDDGEWSTQVYIGQTEALFTAIANYDRKSVSQLIAKGVDINRRDHVGRKALHVAILVKADEIACDLIDAGAQMMSRLVDGRNSLHLAAQMDMPVVVHKLMERSKKNKMKAEKDGKVVSGEDVEERSNAAGRLSSEDDWTSEDDGVISMATDEDVDDDEHEENGGDGDEDEEGEGEEGDSKAKPGTPAIKETADASENVLHDDGAEEPDILDINLPDWDLGFTPLCHAIFSATASTVSALLEEGADPTLLSKSKATVLHPLAVTIMKEDEDEAARIAECLIKGGASFSAAEFDSDMFTIFHRAVTANKTKLVATILRCDPNAQAVLNYPSSRYGRVIFPVVNVIHAQQYAMLALLLAYGAKLAFKEEDLPPAGDKSGKILGQGTYRGENTSLGAVCLPLETAIARHDDVVQLLISLGAEVNTTLQYLRCYNPSEGQRRSLLDWVQAALNYLDNEIRKEREAPLRPPALKLDPEPAATGWRRFLVDMVMDSQVQEAKYYAQRNASARSPRTTPPKEEVRDFLLDVEKALLAKGAESWRTTPLINNPPSLPTPEPVQPVQPTKPRMHYSTLRSYSVGDVLHQYQGKLYDELFEACFSGDNEKVQEMCLPPKGSDIMPLSVFVEAYDPTNRYQNTGYSPLFAAIAGRKWTTAKIVLAIAAAQHKPTNEEKVFTMKGLHLDDTASDSGDSDNSDESDVTVDQKREVTFVDIAKRPSAIETSLHPGFLLNNVMVTSYHQDAEGKYTQRRENLLGKAIFDDDLETFVKILGLYTSSPLVIELPTLILDQIIQRDRVDMLDAYIRHSGVGIDMKISPEDSLSPTNDQNRIYLGLNVHGKKRADLAKKIDPNASHRLPSSPLVWRAALQGSPGIIDYLAGDRPLAAYKHYSLTGGDDVAIRMRRVPDLEKVLLHWLGWHLTDFGDSPLVAAAIGGKVEVLMKLFSNKPKLMASCLRERVKFTGYNALMIAVERKASPDTIDFLLAKSLSPLETDHIRGWNIYHIMCESDNHELLKHCLAKLPKDVNETLLSQQSKGRHNTPLHLAVKKGYVRMVESIVNYLGSRQLMRDIDGSTPLHCAILRGFDAITEILVKSSSVETLYIEDGVGTIPIDMCTLKQTLEIVGQFRSHGNSSQVAVLPSYMPFSFPLRINIENLEKELPALFQMIAHLESEGILAEGTPLVDELCRFAEMMETKLTIARMKREAEVTTTETPVGVRSVPRATPKQCDRARTLQVIRKAVEAQPRKRLLVHLFDVQRSVQGNLERSAGEKPMGRLENDEFDHAEQVDLTAGSMVSQWIRVLPDTI